MRVNTCVGCRQLCCADVVRQSYVVPDVDLEPSKIRVAMISEAPPTPLVPWTTARPRQVRLTSRVSGASLG
jgi:hypothetical protein